MYVIYTEEIILAGRSNKREMRINVGVDTVINSSTYYKLVIADYVT